MYIAALIPYALQPEHSLLEAAAILLLVHTVPTALQAPAVGVCNLVLTAYERWYLEGGRCGLLVWELGSLMLQSAVAWMLQKLLKELECRLGRAGENLQQRFDSGVEGHNSVAVCGC